MPERKVNPELALYLKEYRVATFVDWPFVSDCACTPERMAEAGFIHTPSENAPDVVQCFFCFKELEGWEPEDDPMEEHRMHSPNCALLGLQKDIANLTMQELLKLDKERTANLLKRMVNLKIIKVEKYAAKIRNKIDSYRY